jgi:hypothetical protein
MALSRVLHLLVFTFWLGAILYFTFVAAPVLFKGLPRDQFGFVQSKLFPSYYVIGYTCGVLLLLSYPLIRAAGPWTGADTLKAGALVAMLAFSLLQGLWAGPRVGRLRIERLEAEAAKDQARVEALKPAFGKAHGVSSLANLFVVIGGVVYLVMIAKEWRP